VLPVPALERRVFQRFGPVNENSAVAAGFVSFESALAEDQFGKTAMCSSNYMKSSVHDHQRNKQRIYVANWIVVSEQPARD
jgi:hypothetical protein